jgi:hypothetical protein
MIRPYQYIYYKLYQVSYRFGSKWITERATWGYLSSIVGCNVITLRCILLLKFNIPFSATLTECLTPFGLALVINHYLFIKDKKYLKIIEKFKNEKPVQSIIGHIVVESYGILSFILAAHYAVLVSDAHFGKQTNTDTIPTVNVPHKMFQILFLCFIIIGFACKARSRKLKFFDYQAVRKNLSAYLYPLGKLLHLDKFCFWFHFQYTIGVGRTFRRGIAVESPERSEDLKRKARPDVGGAPQIIIQLYNHVSASTINSYIAHSPYTLDSNTVDWITANTSVCSGVSNPPDSTQAERMPLLNASIPILIDTAYDYGRGFVPIPFSRGTINYNDTVVDSMYAYVGPTLCGSPAFPPANAYADTGDCRTNLTNLAISNARIEYWNYTDSIKNAFEARYTAHCMNHADSNEQFNLTHAYNG